ncbi:hypothetical protein G9A89_004068 [Geosiphon pyriformis]|nr:hypothetical protein G9A89_004068 [Geosiphon pyriformis]
MTNYEFHCKDCSLTGEECFKRTQASWKEIGGCSIANLALQEHMQHSAAKPGDKRYLSANAHNLPPFNFYFNKKNHIVPFVDKNWFSLCTNRERTLTWWATLGSTLYTHYELFVIRDDEESRSAGSNFCLANSNLWHIKPNFFTRDRQNATSHDISRASRDMTVSTRSNKKGQNTTPPSTGSNTNSSSISAAFVQSGEQRNLRNGFRYLPCQEDKLFPYLQYRNSELKPYGVRLSKEDASLSVYISADQLTATTDKGFRMARANCSVREGKWFYEVFIDRGGEGQIDGKDGAHVRVGWARREGSRNTPVGFDGYSYGIRDLTGEKVHQSRPKKFGEPFKTGDVIGLYISLPPPENGFPGYQVKSARRHRTAIKLKTSTVFEYKDYKPTKQMDDLLIPPLKKKGSFAYSKADDKTPTQSQPSIPTIPGSKIIVYKNAVCQGVAFEDLYSFLPCPDESTRKDDLTDDDGTLGYFPAISMFGGGTCTVNFGPHFRFPPPADPEADLPNNPPTPSSLPSTPAASTSHGNLRTWRPMSERYREFIAEDVVNDLVDDIGVWDIVLKRQASERAAKEAKTKAKTESEEPVLKKRKKEV